MSGAAESNVATAVGRTKDGVPTWSGEANLFVQYEEAALLWEQSLTWEKRYTAGPKLVQELSGAARRLVAGQPPGWVAYRGGVRVLMDHLRRGLGKPRVNEVTDLLAAYFKGTRRRAQESMNDYITRKTEAYMRACQALKRVQPHYENPPRASRAQGRRHSGDGAAWSWSRQWTPLSEGGSGPREDGAANVEDDGNHAAESEANTSTTATHRDTRSHHDWWAPSWTSWGATSWSWNAGWGAYRGTWSYEDQGSSTTASYEDERQPQELLPVFIQGWYLLTDAALDSHERNLVVTALNGNFNPARVAQELRNQFSEQEVKRRDQRARHQSYLGETLDYIDDEEEAEEFVNEDLDAVFNEEGFAMMSTAEEEAQTALAAIQTAKRTLREARYKQHQVKQNRKYYQPSSSRNPSSANAKPKDDSNLDCLRCGRRGHRAANCPHKPIGDGPPQSNLAQAGSSSSEPQQAPFVCYLDKATVDDKHGSTEGLLTDFVGYATDECFQATDAAATISTSEAVAQGMAVIDGGATQTIGSVKALEAVLAKNRQKYGTSGLKGVSVDEPPTFSFGNSTENRCLSTAQLHVQANGGAGELRVHTLECGESPILLSIQTLRSLKAIIDFESDVVVFRALDPHRLVHLTRGSSGHQLLSLTEDLLSNSTSTARAVPSLLSFADS